MHSAVFHWRNTFAAKAFNCWRIVHEQNKLHPGTDGSVSPGGGRGAKTHTTQVGLRNLGNTCYLNAVLQALIAVPSFRRSFVAIFPGEDFRNVEAHIEERATSSSSRNTRHAVISEVTRDDMDDGKDISLTREMHLLMHVVMSRKLVRYTPDGILRIVWKLFEEFRCPRQHDAAEILVHIIDQLEREQQSTIEDIFGGKEVQRIEYHRNAGDNDDDDEEEEEEEEEEQEDGDGDENDLVSATQKAFCGPWKVDVPQKYLSGES